MRLPFLVAALSMPLALHAQVPRSAAPAPASAPASASASAPAIADARADAGAAAVEGPGADAAAAAAAGLRPDIEFSADIRMQSLRFGTEPRAAVRFRGGPQLDGRHDVERDGLPAPVATGRTYRNVTVRTTIAATLLDPALAIPATAGAAAAPVSPPTDEDTP